MFTLPVVSLPYPTRPCALSQDYIKAIFVRRSFKATLDKMLLRVFNLISFAAFGLCVAKEQMLPVTICHRDAMDYSTCLRDAIQEAWPRFIPGLPEFNFPPIDPAFYDHHYATYDNGELHISAHSINSTFIGLRDVRFLDVKAYFTDNIFHLEIVFQTPQVSLEGLAHVVGRVGPFGINSTDKLFQDFTNEYWPAILRIVAPVVTKTVEPMFVETTNCLFSNVFFSKVFPK
ncbi:hypothetical protein DMN91_000202 [Ooceraea biroi]|uniref:Circadian clock-controlled protein n=1 Tax=Ooceraea biroi TaxID=2015173 RepID=A0A3L8E340_OOCBI|nr:hypothetical protein DMN91_000202 [Ooceraea biroi]